MQAANEARGPLVVSYSYGADSTAMLVGMHQRGIRPDALLFADTGSETEESIAYRPTVDAWLAKIGFPAVTIVRYEPVLAPYTTIEGNMAMNCTLPGACFGRGSCTVKFKIVPQNKWTQRWAPAVEAWNQGLKVLKAIGFEAEEDYRTKRACDKAFNGDPKDAARYEYWYPLQDWGWSRERCIAEVEAAGLPRPPKTFCYFCPNAKPHEIDDLTPQERGRIMRIEIRAEPYNRKVEGLWRRTRKSDGRPGSITEYILQQGLEYMDPELLDIVDPMPINPKCNHANTGRTFRKDGEDVYLSKLVDADRISKRPQAEKVGV